MTETLPVKLQAWRQFAVGARVELKCRWKRGESGTVVEVFDPADFTGMARYAVRLDRSGLTADLCRHEIRKERQ